MSSYVTYTSNHLFRPAQVAARWVMTMDPSLTGFAIACAREDDPAGTLELHEDGSKSFGKAPTIDERIARYDELIDRAVAIAKHRNPRILLVEGYSYASKGAVIYLGEFGGLLRWRIRDYADTFMEVPPATLKKFACGNGNAKKPAVVSALAQRYGQHFKTDNQADAFGLLQMALCMAKVQEPRNAHERDALKTMWAAEGRGTSRKRGRVEQDVLEVDE